MKLTASLLAVAGLALTCAAQQENQKPPEDQQQPQVFQPNGAAFQPEKLEPTDERIQSLKLPDGFEISTFAKDLGKPRMIAVGPSGYVYISRTDPGDILLLADSDGDGTADTERRVARIPYAHGLAVRNSTLYISTIHEVLAADIRPDGSLSRPRVLIDDLPDGGQHFKRTLGFDDAGFLYISIGSTCNDCNDPNPEHATILRADPDGRTIFAQGLRNTLGFDWHPETRELWGMDQGIDWLGNNEGKEELNRITQGSHYGWPWVYNEGKINPTAQLPPNGMTKEEVAQNSEPPALMHTAHASPIGFLFYTGDNFPDEYKNDAIAAFHGSWNREKPSGYEVVRIRFDDAGQPERIEPFITGFLANDGKAQFGRPCGLAQLPDGSLLLGDDDHGVIYRITYDRATAQKP